MIGQLVLLLLFGVDNYALADCTQRPIDLALIVDASGSVGASNFDKQLMFMQNLVSMADIDSGKVRVGTVVFSSNARVEFHLNSYSTSAGVKDAIRRISFDSGKTNTGSALQLTRTDIFRDDSGDRDDADNIAVLITDGDNWIDDPYDEATALKDQNVRVIVVATGVAVDNFVNIASVPSAKHIFRTNTFDEIDGLRSSVFQSVCKLGTSCQRFQRQAAGNSCFQFEISALGRDLQEVASALQEQDGKDLSECAKLCMGHPECLSFVIRDDGRCQLFDVVCDKNAMTAAPSSRVYVLRQRDNDN